MEHRWTDVQPDLLSHLANGSGFTKDQVAQCCVNRTPRLRLSQVLLPPTVKAVEKAAASVCLCENTRVLAPCA